MCTASHLKLYYCVSLSVPFFSQSNSKRFNIADEREYIKVDWVSTQKQNIASIMILKLSHIPDSITIRVYRGHTLFLRMWPNMSINARSFKNVLFFLARKLLLYKDILLNIRTISLCEGYT